MPAEGADRQRDQPELDSQEGHHRRGHQRLTGRDAHAEQCRGHPGGQEGDQPQSAHRGDEGESLVEEDAVPRHRDAGQHFQSADLLLTRHQTGAPRDSEHQEDDRKHQREEFDVEEAGARRHRLDLEELAHCLRIGIDEGGDVGHVLHERPEGAHDPYGEDDSDRPADEPSPLVPEILEIDGRSHHDSW